MGEELEENEGARLRRAWDRVAPETLDTYLVAGVEDPRINAQSILNRGLLCDALFPGRFTRLIDEELRFGFVLTWLLRHLEMGVDRGTLLAAIRDDDGDRCPAFVLETFRRLQESTSPLSDYVSAVLEDDAGTYSAGLAPQALDTFQEIWSQELGRHSRLDCSLFEPACGSANDFRYLESFGFTRFVRYTGLDLAPKNIANARRRFPHADFRVADLLENAFEDNAFEFSFVHDLFEHLSAGAVERALQEMLRVTRREVWFHFFSARDLPSHEFRPDGSYHWNALSIRELVRAIAPSALHVEVIRIAELAKTKLGFGRYYNPGACTIIATKGLPPSR